MLIKNYVINELTILLAEKTQIPAKEIQNILSKSLYNYDIVKIKTTLPSTNNGEATKYLFKKFAEAKISIGMKQKTLYQYKLAVEKICKTEKMDLNLLTSENIIHFINTMRREGLAPGTIKHKYLLLSSIFSFLYNHRYISYNPMVETDTPKGIQKEKSH